MNFHRKQFFAHFLYGVRVHLNLDRYMPLHLLTLFCLGFFGVSGPGGGGGEGGFKSSLYKSESIDDKFHET